MLQAFVVTFWKNSACLQHRGQQHWWHPARNYSMAWISNHCLCQTKCCYRSHCCVIDCVKNNYQVLWFLADFCCRVDVSCSYSVCFRRGFLKLSYVNLPERVATRWDNALLLLFSKFFNWEGVGTKRTLRLRNSRCHLTIKEKTTRTIRQLTDSWHRPRRLLIPSITQRFWNP